MADHWESIKGTGVNVTKLRRKWLAGKGLLVAGTGTIEPVVFLGPTLDRGVRRGQVAADSPGVSSWS